MKIITLHFLLVLNIICKANAQAFPATDSIPRPDLENFYKYIGDHIRYPRPDLNSLTTGMVIVTFKVANHHAYDIEVQKTPTITLGRAVVTLLQSASIPSLTKPDITYVLPVFYYIGSGDYTIHETIPKIHKRGLQPDEKNSPNHYYFKMQEIRGYSNRNHESRTTGR